MISSTAIDLLPHREQVRDACMCEGIFPIGMESLPARDADAIRVSLEMVDRADVYIGVFAWRYGHIPKGGKISITEMEFNRAVERGIPILVFVAQKDHPITIGMVETNQGSQKKLKRLKDRACKGRNRREFKSPEDLRAEVIHALSDLKFRELRPVSPAEAIRAEKQRLESLDPRFRVDITATAESMHLQIRPVEHITGLPMLKVLEKDRPDELKAFFETGQSFQVRASEIKAHDWPIFDTLLRECGDTNVTFTNAAQEPGCLQFAFRASSDEWLQIQVDGKWSLVPQKAVFKGQMNDSPLGVECVRETHASGGADAVMLKFRLDWNVWAGQPLLGLSYLSELSQFARSPAFTARSFVRGNQLWAPDTIRVSDSERQQLVDAFDWLLKCRHAARSLHVNPPFPRAETINADDTASKEVQLMMKLIEIGVHEQSNAGQTVGISVVGSADDIKVGAENLTASWTEPFRNVHFFGVEVPFGPLSHTWTDLQLLAVRPLADGRQELEFKGGAMSLWKIEYTKPGASAPAGPSNPPPPKT